MVRRTGLSLALVGLGSLLAQALETCGPAQYDPTQYVCHPGDFLCPITAGEPLSYCSGACYSKFMYACENGELRTLPRTTGPMTLSVSNPTLPIIDGAPISACGQHWWIGGAPCTYCPSQVPPEACPPGDKTVVFSTSAMAVLVPGGQQYYLDPYWNVGYTQAHSAYVPPGSTIGGFAAFQTGGFYNLNPGALGWVACPSRASGGGGNDGRWNLVAKNETNAATLNGCTAVNLRVTELPSGTLGAWQYT